MKELEKRIELNENRILIYRITDDYPKALYSITEGFLENGNLIKSYSLLQWDDYGLNGWINDDKEKEKLSFEFDINHPLYMPLFHLLNYDEELVIEDDDTREYNKKYLLIHRIGNKVYMDFIDKINSISNMTEKFHIFIKNIMPDGRSKIDSNYKDTKIRLIDFFGEAHKSIINNTHQISFEEYCLSELRNDTCSELKKVFKKQY